MILDKKPLLPPPWLAYPAIERYSIGWRMGYGESYMSCFSVWYEQLSHEERKEYQLLFPEPITWTGYWRDDEEEDCGEDESLYFENGDFLLQLWKPEGTPKYDLAKIQEDYRRGEQKDCLLFWGHQPSKDGTITKSCLSQWWQSKFSCNVYDYFCMEQFMMGSKAQLFDDQDILQKILSSHDPKQIKALGRKVRSFDQEMWDKVKYSIVLNGNYRKFTQNQELKTFLLSTGDSILVEASPYDGVWGIRLPEDSPASRNPLKWKGENLLGFALMELRDELKRVCKNESLCDFPENHI